MAAVTFPHHPSLRIAPAPRVAAMARGTLLTIGGHITSLARPVAIAWFARMYGASALGGFLLVWTCVELGGRLATLGFDRGIQRWTDGRRAAATVAGMATAGITGFAMALAIVPFLPRILPDGAMASQLLVVVGLPSTAISNVALRASRGSTQIATYVVARGVTEPLLLLVAGVVSSSFTNGSVALPVSLMISIVGGATVAIIELVRTFGVRELVTSRAWPLRELVRTSLPLGAADLLQNAQAKLDLVAVALTTLSPTAITTYAIAAEVAGVFVAVRIGFDQIVAPLAAEARADREEQRRILTTATRWSAMLAAPIAFAVLVAPDTLLRWCGGSSDGVIVLLVLAAGRAIEMVLAPFATMLAITGRPTLSLLDAGLGVAIATAGQVLVGIACLGPFATAIASSAGVVCSSLLAVYWRAGRRKRENKPSKSSKSWGE